MSRVAVRVIAANHTHRGRRCAPGEVIHLSAWQVQWLGNRVQRAHAPDPAPVLPTEPTLPAAPEAEAAAEQGDDSGGEDADPDPDPQPPRPRDVRADVGMSRAALRRLRCAGVTD